MKLLIIEDQKDLAESIRQFIAGEHYKSDLALTFSKAVELIKLNEYDCALVDIMLPDGSGLNLIAEIKKAQPTCGIIVISAKGSIDDKIGGLNIGADDYLAKPFHLAELNARINSVIRRRKFEGNNQITLDELKIDLNSREVFVNGSLTELTRREYDILIFFISNKEKVLTKESIVGHIWGEDSNAFGELDFLYTHIKNLRKKIIERGGKDRISSVYGIGYKFSAG
ncbi:MAG: response regulator transcription factor [Bacteroidetes bacterium]|nr:response regulator transcription factor [Bacteroidota bacterium]